MSRRTAFRIEWKEPGEPWCLLGSKKRLDTFATRELAEGRCRRMLDRSSRLHVRIIAPDGKPVAVTKIVKETVVYKVRKLVAVKR